MAGLRNVLWQPDHNSGRQDTHRNPSGFSFSTVRDVVKAAAPGLSSFLRDAMPEVGHVLGTGSTWSMASMANRMRALHYAEADAKQIQHECAGHVTVEDFMPMPYKSYKEMGRATLRLMIGKAVHDVTQDNKFVACPGDWPSQAFTNNIVRMGWTVSPQYLGYFLYCCCLPCSKTGAPANHELWEQWCRRCGKEGDDAVLALGTQARLLVCTIGPLQVSPLPPSPQKIIGRLGITAGKKKPNKWGIGCVCLI